MGDWSLSVIVILLFLLVIIYVSQTKFKNKMLCYFIRPNRMRIKKWVPLYSKYVVFDRGKYGTLHYECDPNCIAMEWYTGGINKLMPVLVPTLEFKWDTPNPLNPTTFESTWHTPEARHAGWEEHQHIAFAKATAAQAGRKSRFPEWFLPLVTIVLVLAVLFIVYQGITGLDERMFNLEQMIKVK